MKKLLFTLLLLVPVLLFSQAPWVYTSGGHPVSLVHSVPDSTVFPDFDTNLDVMIYLRGYVSGSATGSGWFNSATSASALDGVNVFNHPDTGVRYVRMVTITSTLTVMGDVDFPVAVCDTNAFSGTGTADTVTVSGSLVTDKYIITMRGTSLDAQDTQFIVSPLNGSFIVTRPANGASGLKYTWLRIK